MPWDLVTLNDGESLLLFVNEIAYDESYQMLCHDIGYKMPSIAFGTWTLGNGQGPVDQVDQAISVGFSHIGKSYPTLSPQRFLMKWQFHKTPLRATTMKLKLVKQFARVD